MKARVRLLHNSNDIVIITKWSGKYVSQFNTLQISSPWKPPATIKLSLTLIVLIWTLERGSAKHPGYFCKDIVALKTEKIQSDCSLSILISGNKDYQCRYDRFSYIKHFFTPPKHGGPVHHRVVLHQVYIMFRGCPQKIPQLKGKNIKLISPLL